MQVRDLMTRSVMTVPPDTSLPTLAALFAERSISGVPVVTADGTLLGLVTESDVLRRIAAEEMGGSSWLKDMFASAQSQARDFARIHGHRAEDVMSTSLVTVREGDSIAHAAALLEKHGIRRLPVLGEDGRLVGILSRADLIRAVLAPADKDGAALPDREVERRLREAMREQPWVDAYFLFVDVTDGVATFHGFCRSDAVRQALRVMAEGTPGVRGVRFDLSTSPPFVL